MKQLLFIALVLLSSCNTKTKPLQNVFEKSKRNLYLDGICAEWEAKANSEWGRNYRRDTNVTVIFIGKYAHIYKKDTLKIKL